MLTAVGLGSTWLVDAVEVFPEGPCPRCHGAGQVLGTVFIRGTYDLASERRRRGDHERRELMPCPVCCGTGVRGEPVERGMILVDHLGSARKFFGQERMPGEAFHREHACANVQVGPDSSEGLEVASAAA